MPPTASQDLHERAAFSAVLEADGGDPAVTPPRLIVDPDAARASAPQPFPAPALAPVLRDASAARPGDVVAALYPAILPDAPARERLARAGLRLSAWVVRAGRIGDERARTHGHVTPSVAELYEIWAGEALLYAQSDVRPEVGDVVTWRLSPGDKALLPPDWVGVLVNVGDAPLAAGVWRASGGVPPPDPAPLAQTGGPAHFVLAASDRAGFRLEPNTRYRSVPVPRRVPPGALHAPPWNLNTGEPVLSTLRRAPDALRFLTAADPREFEAAWASL